MKDMCMNKKTVRGFILLLMLVSMIFILCACTATDDEITGIWEGKASDFSEQDEKLDGSDEVYYLHIKGSGAFDIFTLQEKKGQTVRVSLLKQPGTYRLSGGWLVMNEAAASKPYVNENILSLKNGKESVNLQRMYGVTYEFTGDVPRTQKNKLPKDDKVYKLGDPFEVDSTFETGFVEDKLAKSEGKIYTFKGWKCNGEDITGGEIADNVVITGEWVAEPVPGMETEETVAETSEGTVGND